MLTLTEAPSVITGGVFALVTSNVRGLLVDAPPTLFAPAKKAVTVCDPTLKADGL